MARGWRDTYYFLGLPPLEEKSKFFNLFSDCPLMTCSSCLANLFSSICVASPRFISAFLTQRKWYMPPVRLGWQRISCYENRTDALGDLPACCSCGVRPNPFCRNSPATTRAFLFQKSEIKPEPGVHCAIRTGDRMSPRGQGPCNLMVARGCER
jgi:hypothetical protein